MDLDSVADELYGLSLEDFTATRNRCAKQARAAGERELAAQIQALRKPTHAAWLLNQLVRAHAEEVQLLLDLGRELRDVLADVEGDQLRELTRQRYQLVSALVQQTRSLGLARGTRVSDDVALAVRATLEATLADESSADTLAAGRLTEPLEVASGFSVGSADVDRRGSAPRAAPEATVADLGAERRRRAREAAERELATAGRRAEKARASADRARRHLESVRQRTESATTAVDRLREELEAQVAALTQLQQQERDAQDELQVAEQAAQEAAAERAQLSRRNGRLALAKSRTELDADDVQALRDSDQR